MGAYWVLVFCHFLVVSPHYSAWWWYASCSLSLVDLIDWCGLCINLSSTCGVMVCLCSVLPRYGMFVLGLCCSSILIGDSRLPATGAVLYWYNMLLNLT